jgi:hypothetical protein
MNELLDLRAGHWNLHIWPHRHYEQLLSACAALAERGPLLVLDCNRRYNPAVVARAARGRAEITDRIQSQRAFICYEVVKLLQHTPASRTPVMVLDMLASFYDENVQLRMRRFLIENSLLHLERLSSGGGLAVFVQPPPAGSDSLPLFERFQSAASQVLIYQTYAPEAEQLGLF